jgi:hypothetical protein
VGHHLVTPHFFRCRMCSTVDLRNLSFIHPASSAPSGKARLCHIWKHFPFKPLSARKSDGWREHLPEGAACFEGCISSPLWATSPASESPCGEISKDLFTHTSTLLQCAMLTKAGSNLDLYVLLICHHYPMLKSEKAIHESTDLNSP